MDSLMGIREKWKARLAEWRELGVRIDGEKVAAEILEDLRTLVAEDTVTLKEAALIGGYSVDHLQRLVAQSTLQNVGRKGAPRLRRQDVPTKPGHGSVSLPILRTGDHMSARRRIVADARTRKGA